MPSELPEAAPAAGVCRAGAGNCRQDHRVGQPGLTADLVPFTAGLSKLYFQQFCGTSVYLCLQYLKKPNT